MFQRIRTAIRNWLINKILSCTLRHICTVAGIPVMVDRTNSQYKAISSKINLDLGGGFYSPLTCPDALGKQIILLPHNWWCYITESQLAAILQHEIGHVVNKHHLTRNSLWRDAANEFQADLYVVQCGLGENMISLLESLVNHMERYPNANPLTGYQIDLAKRRIKKIQIAMNLM